MNRVALLGFNPAKWITLNDPNGHKYLRVKINQAKKEWRKAGWALGNSRPKPKITGRATVLVRFGTDLPNQRRDPSNWAPTVKALIDGLTDAKFWPDDDSRHVATLEPTFTTDLGAGRFEIIITWEDPE